MVLDACLSASPKAKVLNSTFFLFNILAWICCCVSFGGKLIHVVIQGPQTLNFKFNLDIYWNHVYSSDINGRLSFDSESAFCKYNDFCSKCQSGGRALVALQVFAFLGLTAVLFLTTVRMLGSAISFLEPTRKSLLLEFGLTVLNTFWFFLSVAVYGGTCFTAVRNQETAHPTGTGFGFLIACFFFLVLNVFVGWALRKDASTHLGSGALGGAGGSDYQRESDVGGEEAHTTNYNPNAASYQYNAADAQSFAGQYNGDVVPAGGAPQGDNNL